MTSETYAKISSSDRQRVVSAYLDGLPSKVITEVMHLKRSTVDSIIKVYIKCNRIGALKRGCVQQRKLTDEHREAIKA